MRFFRVGTYLILGLTFTFGCQQTQDPAPEGSCVPLIENFNAALIVYNDDVSSREKCVAVKAAGLALLDCPALTEPEKADYKKIIDDIYCY